MRKILNRIFMFGQKRPGLESINTHEPSPAVSKKIDLDRPISSILAEFSTIDTMLVLEVLEKLVAIEVEAEREDARTILRGDLYASYDSNKIRLQFKDEVSAGEMALRKYAEQLQPATLEQMRQRYNFLLDPEVAQFLDSDLKLSIAGAYLRGAWDGIGPWKK